MHIMPVAVNTYIILVNDYTTIPFYALVGVLCIMLIVKQNNFTQIHVAGTHHFEFWVQTRGHGPIYNTHKLTTITIIVPI